MTSHTTDVQNTTTGHTAGTAGPQPTPRLPALLGPSTGSRALLAATPVLLMVVVALTDLLTPDWLHVSPVRAAVPVLAAVLLPYRATAALGGAALVITALLQWDAGSCGHPDADVTLGSLFVVGLTSLAACSLRQRRERQLRQVRSVAETAQRALMHPLPPRIGSLALSGVYRRSRRRASAATSTRRCPRRTAPGS
ncbi:hypothetical protein SRB17_44590 [Streptomyces sp. RB17]|uniref:hypothetical protein n=1 Tax=Streptomyces sp. RB17 TaxID=2585197 RepID=UPI0013094982|nr:hypothetical protein [Streptomyces sp. RB17]MQY36458.1 hypothetical protein [Streptomyces sp. RB17]